MRFVLTCTLLFALVSIAGCQTTTTITTASGEMVEKNARPRPAKPTAASELRNRAQVRIELASGYYRNGNMVVALEEARQATLIDPTFGTPYSLLGLIYMDMNDQRQAGESFDKALALEPNNADILNNYGWFLCRGGRQRDSISYFERAARDPLYATPARAYQNAGVCLMQVKDYAAAEPFLRKSLEADAGSPVAKFQLARVYLATNQLERADFYYKLMMRSTDSSSETLWLGLRIAHRAGDVRGESQLARELVDRFPRSPEAALLQRGAFDE